ncbi:hypothetical protein RDI58_017615 [Solanum bulbocastanum]|uniref:Uncharacterized protein n=1 Tax=Solanum bulbocastanum TaxID=147425 RepID=A0AAN8TI18_SOLBU
MGLSLKRQNLNQVLVTWWTALIGCKLQQIMKVSLNVWQFAMTSFPSLKQFPTNWLDMFQKDHPSLSRLQ